MALHPTVFLIVNDYHRIFTLIKLHEAIRMKLTQQSGRTANAHVHVVNADGDIFRHVFLYISSKRNIRIRLLKNMVQNPKNKKQASKYSVGVNGDQRSSCIVCSLYHLPPHNYPERQYVMRMLLSSLNSH